MRVSPGRDSCDNALEEVVFVVDVVSTHGSVMAGVLMATWVWRCGDMIRDSSERTVTAMVDTPSERVLRIQ